MIARGRSIAGILATLALLVVGFFCLPISAWAAEIQAEGIHVALESDQDSYVPGDVATFTLSATNQGEQTLRSANYALSFPGNMAAVDVSAVEDDLGILAPNETKTVQVKATVLSDTQAMLVRTGDGSSGSAVLLLMFAVVGMAVFMMRNQKSATVTFRKVSRRSRMKASSETMKHLRKGTGKIGRSILSVLLVFGLIVSIPFAAIPQAQAEESMRTVSLTHKINVSDSEQLIRASLSIPCDTSSIAIEGEIDDKREPDGAHDSESQNVESSLISGGGTSLGSGGPKAEVTRGQWLSMVLSSTPIRTASEVECPYVDIANNAYRQDIATAYAQGIIPDAESTVRFDPNSAATREFALASAVLACGFTDDGSKLKVADASEAHYPALLAISLDMDMTALDEENRLRPADDLTKSEADKICEAVSAFFASDRISTEGVDIVFQPDVTVIDEYDVTSSGFIVDSRDFDIVVGSKVAFEGTDAHPEGAAGTVTSVSPAVATGSGIEVEIAQATDPEDIFSSIKITEYDKALDMSQAELADGIEFDDGAEPFSLEQAAFNPSFETKMRIKKEIPKFGTISASVKMKPSVTIDIEWEAFAELKKFEYIIANKATVDVKYEAEKTLAEGTMYSLPLLKKPMNIPLAYGIGIAFNASLEIKATGEAEVSASLEQAAGVKYKNGHLSTYQDGGAEAEFAVSAEVSAGLAPAAMLTVMSVEIFDLTCEVGAKVKGTATLRSTGTKCNDISAYLYGKLGSGQNTIWMEKLNLKLTYANFWTEKTSPKKWNLHYEDGKRVKKCTYGEGGGGLKDDQANTGKVISWSCNEEDKWNEYCSANACVYGGSELLVESDDWFDFKYSTNFDAPTGASQGAVFRIAWMGTDDDAWHEKYYADDVDGASPIHKGKVRITVFSGHVDLFETACLRQAPSLTWGICDEIPYPLHISDSAIELRVGESFQLTCWQDISEHIPALNDLPAIADCEDVWWSVFEECVTVNSDGVVMAVSPGYSYVRCEYRGFSRLCTVTVI